MPETTVITETVKGVKITKTASIKPHGETDAPTKKVTLVIDFDGTTLASVFESAVRSDVIKWQGNNRDNFDNIVDGSTIQRKFSAPPVAVVTEEDGKQAFRNKLASFDTDEERQAYIDETLKNVQK